MRVYGYFYNSRGKLQYGVHDVDEKGRVKQIRKMERLSFTPAREQERLLDEEAIRRFQVDINETSLLIAVKDEEPILRYVDGDEVNPHKVYYFGKDLEDCFYCQDRALDCLEYIAYQYPEYKDFAYAYVYRYLELREDPEADLDSLLEDAKGSSMVGIQHAL